MIAYGAIIIALGAAIVAVTAFSGLDVNYKVIVAITAASTIIGAMVIAWGIYQHRNPHPGSRKYLIKKYNKLEVPPEAERFVALFQTIQEYLKKLQNAQDEKKRMAILQELQSLTAEAKDSLQENSKLFAAKAHKSKKTSKPHIRIEEFQLDAPIQSTQMEASAPDNDAIAAAQEADALEANDEELRELMIEKAKRTLH